MGYVNSLEGSRPLRETNGQQALKALFLWVKFGYPRGRQVDGSGTFKKTFRWFAAQLNNHVEMHLWIYEYKWFWASHVSQIWKGDQKFPTNPMSLHISTCLWEHLGFLSLWRKRQHNSHVVFDFYSHMFCLPASVAEWQRDLLEALWRQ